jgi:hypothetical protein
MKRDEAIQVIIAIINPVCCLYRSSLQPTLCFGRRYDKFEEVTFVPPTSGTVLHWDEREVASSTGTIFLSYSSD